MSTLRIYRAGLAPAPVDPKLRIFRAGLTGSVPVGPKLRIYGERMTGTLPVAPTLRIFRAALFGVGAVTVAPILPSTVEPMDAVTITAVLATDGSPVWSWRQISGPSVTLIGTGASRTFTTPATQDGTTLVLGVTATVGGSVSAEQQVTVAVLPQIVWTRTHSNPVWRGSKISL